MARLPVVLLTNTSNLGRGSQLDLEAAATRLVTFQVTTLGTGTFSLDLEGGILPTNGSVETFSPLVANVTAPGLYTTDEHLVRRLSANLKSVTGSLTVSVAVVAADPQ